MSRVEKGLHVVAAAFAVLVLALAACAPAPSAPTGGGSDRICNWVRERVKDGSLPIEHATGWYAHCGPFEYPDD